MIQWSSFIFYTGGYFVYVYVYVGGQTLGMRNQFNFGQLSVNSSRKIS